MCKFFFFAFESQAREKYAGLLCMYEIDNPNCSCSRRRLLFSLEIQDTNLHGRNNGLIGIGNRISEAAVLKSDCASVVQLFANPDGHRSRLFFLIQDGLEYVKRLPVFTVKHAKIEQNKTVAHELAQQAKHSRQKYLAWVE